MTPPPPNPAEFGIQNSAALDLVRRQAYTIQQLTARIEALEKLKKPLTGVGTPEGAVVAAIGTLYTRTDGGASTTLYVKESGTGNTGWVAK